MQSFDSRDFRQTLGRFATGITVVTMREAVREVHLPRTFGITVNAFMSVSLEPPLVAVSIDKSARAHATLGSSDRFGISVLGADQAHLSDLFAGRPVAQRRDPFVDFADFPVVDGAIAQLVCRAHDRFDAGDHTLFVGRVEALRTREGSPLLYYRGAYQELPELTLSK